ncbi:MAG: GDPmannose 4,6-dehydratase [Microbacteriaceae bacterium]|nr:GDPmannose 4,6-dehydratase [Microbacteriaceae bacterium]
MPIALITGITGQTGSYLAETLLRRGWELHGLIRAEDAAVAASLPAGATPHVGDLSEPESLRDIVEAVGPDSVINLAALSSVAQSWKEPLLTARINGLAVAALLDVVLRRSELTGKAISFVQASSAEIFGSPSIAPQNESTPVAPLNPYGAAKAYAHHLTAVYRALGAAASSCILYNHESPRRPETFVTRKITAGVARIEAGLQDRLTLGDLSVRRDWGWAPDYANAIAEVAAGNQPDNYVIATGESHSIAEFVAAAFSAIGVTDWESYVTVDPALIRPADAPDLRGDSSRMRERFGWKPTKTFESIVAAMVEHDRGSVRSPA